MFLCTLCRSPEVEALTSIKELHYFTCLACDLIFLHPDQHPSHDQELARYKEHRNSAEDPGYRQFLSPLIEEIAQRLAPGEIGLDFGSGPGPAVPAMLKEKGFEVSTYDPFFSPNPEMLKKKYHFITCTETVEHLFDPYAEFELLNSLLKANGWLGVMTLFFDDKTTFSESHYHRDPTHVCFYSTNTFKWIGRTYGWQAFFSRENIVLFQKGTKA